MPPERRVIDLDGDNSSPPAAPDAFYQLYCGCENCDYEDDTEIPKGTKVGDAECPECGCQSLFKAKQITEEVSREDSGEDDSVRRALEDMMRRQRDVVEPTSPAPSPLPYYPPPPHQVDPNPHPMIPQNPGPYRSPSPFAQDQRRAWMTSQGITPPTRGLDPIESAGISAISVNSANALPANESALAQMAKSASSAPNNMLAACGVQARSMQ